MKERVDQITITPSTPPSFDRRLQNRHCRCWTLSRDKSIGRDDEIIEPQYRRKLTERDDHRYYSHSANDDGIY